MLTQLLQKKLTTLFDNFESSDAYMTLNELEGFLHAVAITPEIIQPSEWLPKIFDGQMPEFDSEEQAQSTMGVLMESYNHYNELRHSGKLNYDYDIKKLSVEKFDEIIEWGWGFLIGLRLRMPFWMSRIVADELSVEEDPVANSVGVIKALVDDTFDTTPLINKFKDEHAADASEEELKQHLVVHMLTALPEAVRVIQAFAEHMDERRKDELAHSQQARSNKIGRNELCPCGSGKKYKKCCALTDHDGYLH